MQVKYTITIAEAIRMIMDADFSPIPVDPERNMLIEDYATAFYNPTMMSHVDGWDIIQDGISFYFVHLNDNSETDRGQWFSFKYK